ncbi:F-box and associated interaction domain protein [Medicago truncatula]|uniref:F-box and associated interaction domain protein n=2 Tax=Medicago truncatula TaxID=3880 RepID=G7L5N1_MEDTR|nr:F-box and associated interaction domain protein [Medicago truncatula]
MTPVTPVVLPDDLIAELLSFLPVKSLVRLKCVSKSWKSLISDPSFVKLHLNRSSTRNPLFTIGTLHIAAIPIAAIPIDDVDDRGLEVGYSVVPYSLNCLIQNPLFTLSVDPYHHLGDKECSLMIGSCNGLILLAGGDSQLGYFRLWNPATMTISPNFGYFVRFHGSATHPFPFLGYYNFTFGCDNSTGTYKIVASNYNPDRQHRMNVRILSFGDNVWREIQSFPVVPIHSYFGENDVHNAVYLSSTLNWLAIHNDFDYDIKNLRVEQFVIVSLDLGTETYNQYRLPRDFDEMPSALPIVAVLGGFLCCSYFYKETDFLIWQMKELGNDNSWTQFLKISYQNLQINHDYFGDEEFNHEKIKYHFQLVPLLLSEDADTLVFKNSQESHPILYNWRENRVEQTKVTTSSTIINDNGSSNSTFWCSTKVYFESLVSIF